MAFSEIVIDGNDMAGVQEFFDAHGPNITGSAGDKYIHRATLIERPAMLNGKQGFPEKVSGRLRGVVLACGHASTK
jgi:hypothetical protein